jgi:predicted membrane protein
MRDREHVHGTAGRVVFGLIVLALGVTFLLDNLHVMHAREVFRFWPVALILIGLVNALQPRGGCGRLFWLFVAILGGLLLLERFHYISWSVWDLWPVFLVLAGLSMLWRAISGNGGGRRWGNWGMRHNVIIGDRRHWHGPLGNISGASYTGGPTGGPGANPGASSGGTAGPGAGPTSGGGSGGNHDSVLDTFTIFGGTERTINTRDFRGGRITTIMGGCELDLRAASIAQGEAVLDVFALWGGIEMRVPPDWKVVMQVTPILGGAEDTTNKPEGEGHKTLIVRGEVIMGGFEIRN